MTDTRKPDDKTAVARRSLLTGFGLGAAVLLLPPAAEAEAPPADAATGGYRETEHVRRAYRSFAF
ncbi:MAG TPA: formate dehydrogenase [Rhodospirillaceae bacterium]|nr:formate dehydrogenase [Rhodospirillaceae bacterium]